MSVCKDLRRHGAEKAQAIVAQRQKQQEQDDEDTSKALLSRFVYFTGMVKCDETFVPYAEIYRDI